MKPEPIWTQVRATLRRAFASSFHYAIATVNADGSPHVTPIGSFLPTEPGRGLYFEEYPSRLPANLDRDPRLCLLAVDSGRMFWIKSLLKGRFTAPPAVRLHGTAGPLRDATTEEAARWQRRVRRTRRTKGHKRMWDRMARVRDITFTEVDPVRLGVMTERHWEVPA